LANSVDDVPTERNLRTTQTASTDLGSVLIFQRQW
jgi:hypothetical protein